MLTTLSRVVVSEHVRLTNLGEGIVVDVEPDETGYPARSLVRFEHGPAVGVWYAVGSLEVIE